MEHEHVVQALAPNRTNDALDVGPLPGGSWGAPHFADTHVSHLVSEGMAEDRIAVAQQVARKLVKGEGFAQLLSGPLRGGVGGHIAVDNAAPVMGQHQKHIENLETKGRYGEETDRPTTGGPCRSISGAFLRTAEARRFGGAAPGSPVGAQHAHGRAKTVWRGVS